LTSAGQAAGQTALLYQNHVPVPVPKVPQTVRSEVPYPGPAPGPVPDPAPNPAPAAEPVAHAGTTPTAEPGAAGAAPTGPADAGDWFSDCKDTHGGACMSRRMHDVQNKVDAARARADRGPNG